MSGFEKFKEKFPSKEMFHSLLTSKKVNDKEYEHVLKVWEKFEMKTIDDYHNLHLNCDALLLVDMFKQFRNSRLKNCGLCPSHQC